MRREKCCTDLRKACGDKAALDKQEMDKAEVDKPEVDSPGMGCSHAAFWSGDVVHLRMNSVVLSGNVSVVTWGKTKGTGHVLSPGVSRGPLTRRI